MTTHPSQPADPLDLAILYATLAFITCPDQVRQAIIAVLDQQITPLDQARFDRLLQQLTGNPPDLAGDLDTLPIPPAIARWLRATSPDRPSPTLVDRQITPFVAAGDRVAHSPPG